MSLQKYPYAAVPLSCGIDGLLPNLNEQVMKTNFDQIYCRDVGYLNQILTVFPALQCYSLVQLILYDLKDFDKRVRDQVKYYAGSVYNHALFFSGLATPGSTEPNGGILDAINDRYGSLRQFKNLFADAAASILGNGFVWLNYEIGCDLHICTTQDNNVPEIYAMAPLMALDMWEHAYLQQYEVCFGSYIEHWFEAVDWNQINRRYQNYLKLARSGTSIEQQILLPPQIELPQQG